MTAGIWTKDSGVWTLVPVQYVKNVNIWGEPQQAWVKDAGIWKQVYQTDTTPPAVPQLAALEIVEGRYVKVKIKASNSFDPTLDIVRVLVSSTNYLPNQFSGGTVTTPDANWPAETWSDWKYNVTGGHLETDQDMKEYPPNPVNSTQITQGSKIYVSAWAKDKRGNWSTGVGVTATMPDRSAPGTGTPSIKQKTWTASFSQTFNGDDTLRWNGVFLYQGLWNAANGAQESIIGFPSTAIVQELKNSVVRKVEVFMYSRAAYNPATGFLARYQFHSAASAQPTLGTVTRFGTFGFTTFHDWQGQWIDITALGTAGWKSGSVKGLTFQPNTFDRKYSGLFEGHTQTHPPQLRITYEV